MKLSPHRLTLLALAHGILGLAEIGKRCAPAPYQCLTTVS